jgi:hypothetical protein
MSNLAPSIQAVNTQTQTQEASQPPKQAPAQVAAQAANPQDKVTISPQAQQALANIAKSAAVAKVSSGGQA